MHEIDLHNWPRRAHYELFRSHAQPLFGLTADVEVTGLRRVLKDRDLHFSTGLSYVLTRAANAVQAFRWRIRGEKVVEHAVVHPSVTVDPPDSDLFAFCTLNYTPEFGGFVNGMRQAVARCRTQPSLEDPPGRDDLLFVSSVPWVAFTSVHHPLPESPDSVPRITNGKFVERAGRLVMPLDVQVHHALMDGRHLGLYFAEVQRLLDAPEDWLDG